MEHVCARFIEMLQKQLPLFWNIVWQNLKGLLVQGAAERDCGVDMLVNKKINKILESKFCLCIKSGRKYY